MRDGRRGSCLRISCLRVDVFEILQGAVKITEYIALAQSRAIPGGEQKTTLPVANECPQPCRDIWVKVARNWVRLIRAC